MRRRRCCPSARVPSSEGWCWGRRTSAATRRDCAGSRPRRGSSPRCRPRTTSPPRTLTPFAMRLWHCYHSEHCCHLHATSSPYKPDSSFSWRCSNHRVGSTWNGREAAQLSAKTLRTLLHSWLKPGVACFRQPPKVT